MFEVEQKFTDSTGEIKKFLKSHHPIKEKRTVDVYFDYPQSWTFFKKGVFIRLRTELGQTVLEFKFDTPEISNSNSHDVCIENKFSDFNLSKSLNSLVETSKMLGLNCSKDVTSLKEFLEINSLKPFVKIDKHRKEYEIGEFNIALDDVKELGNFVEIETMVASKRKIKQAIRKIFEFSGRFGLKIVRMGYVEIYLKKFFPEVYELGRFKDKIRQTC